jgi:hypothetical protein
VFDVIGAVVPVVYFGGLLYYFFNQADSVEQAQEMGLGPTLIGLAVVGLLFCIPLILKIARLFGSHSDGSGDDPDGSNDGDFDADAAVARYLARQAAETVPATPSAPVAPERSTPTRRPSFGRKFT